MCVCVCVHGPSSCIGAVAGGLLEAVGFELESDHLRLNPAFYTRENASASAVSGSSSVASASASNRSTVAGGTWVVEVPDSSPPLSVLRGMRDIVEAKAEALRSQWARYVKAPPAGHLWQSVFAVSAAEDIGSRPAMEVPAFLFAGSLFCESTPSSFCPLTALLYPIDWLAPMKPNYKFPEFTVLACCDALL